MINLDGFQTVHMGGGKKDGTLKEKRLVLELTQQEVAEKAKISLSSYQKFENGDRNIRTASFEVACRVLKALSMDPTAFFEYKYVFGEPTIYDEEGRKYVRTGRLVDEDIDDVEAFNVKRVHIHADSIIIPLAILRAMGSPELIQILYQKSEKRLGIRILKKTDENPLTRPYAPETRACIIHYSLHSGAGAHPSLCIIVTIWKTFLRESGSVLLSIGKKL